MFEGRRNLKASAVKHSLIFILAIAILMPIRPFTGAAAAASAGLSDAAAGKNAADTAASSAAPAAASAAPAESISSGAASGQDALFSDIKGKVSGISDKEKETLQRLFTQAQAIEETARKVKGAADDVDKTQARIDRLKKLIEQDEAACEKERQSLKAVLQSYQRMGPGSFLEIILKSDSLPDLLMRINTLRDLAHNTGELLDRIKRDIDKQSAEKAKLSEELAAVKNKRQQLEQTLAEEKKLKEDMEKYLASLQSERGRYQEYLDNIKQAWGEIKPLFEDTARELALFSAKAELPPDAFKISLGLFGAKASISDETINSLISGDSKLNGMKFTFSQDKVTVAFPERNLVLTGRFVVADDYSLEFEPDGGSFFGMPLEKGIVMELLENCNLKLDLKSELQGNKLKSAEISDGYLNISI